MIFQYCMYIGIFYTTSLPQISYIYRTPCIKRITNNDRTFFFIHRNVFEGKNLQGIRGAGNAIRRNRPMQIRIRVRNRKNDSLKYAVSGIKGNERALVLLCLMTCLERRSQLAYRGRLSSVVQRSLTLTHLLNCLWLHFSSKYLIYQQISGVYAAQCQRMESSRPVR